MKVIKFLARVILYTIAFPLACTISVTALGAIISGILHYWATDGKKVAETILVILCAEVVWLYCLGAILIAAGY